MTLLLLYQVCLPNFKGVVLFSKDYFGTLGLYVKIFKERHTRLSTLPAYIKVCRASEVI